MGGNRSEYISAVKGVAAGREEILRVGKVNNPDHRVGRRGQAEEPVIRPDEESVVRLDQQRTPGTADARVDDGDMDRAGREEPGRAAQNQRAGGNVLRGNVVR